MINILVPDEYKSIIFNYDNKLSILDNYTKRPEFVKNVAWHIPTDSLLESLNKYQPLVSVCSGLGYTEFLAQKENINIIATDISPNDNYWCDGKLYTIVETLDAADAILKYNNRNVFMAWPPYNKDIAFRVVNAMEIGRYLIFIGESVGGCTGDDQFFECLDSNFEEITDHNANICRWYGLHDYVYIYQKKSL